MWSELAPSFAGALSPSIPRHQWATSACQGLEGRVKVGSCVELVFGETERDAGLWDAPPPLLSSLV